MPGDIYEDTSSAQASVWYALSKTYQWVQAPYIGHETTAQNTMQLLEHPHLPRYYLWRKKRWHSASPVETTEWDHWSSITFDAIHTKINLRDNFDTEPMGLCILGKNTSTRVLRRKRNIEDDVGNSALVNKRNKLASESGP